MKYRKFGKTGFEVSALSFGCMRYPMKDGGQEVDTDETIAMIRYAIDNGVNYFDTAYVYHDGRSEEILGKALKDGYRQKARVATKLPMWLVEGPDDFDRLLAEQLKRLDMGYIDFYLLHGMNKESTQKTRNLKLLDKLEAAMADGRIKHAGFSFHDDFDCFKEAVDMYDNWSMAQIQFNYMDKNNQAGERGLKYAADKGLAVVTMESCLGGRLANLPPYAAAALEGADKDRTQVQWAYDWLWNYPEVSSVLSGMSAMQQVRDNIAYANESQVGNMSEGDLKRVAKTEQIINSIAQIPCTGCRYCMPCPQGVNIPGCLIAMNEGKKYGHQSALMIYDWWMRDPDKADKCVSCAVCEEKCPQKIKISEEMPKVAAYMAGK